MEKLKTILYPCTYVLYRSYILFESNIQAISLERKTLLYHPHKCKLTKMFRKRLKYTSISKTVLLDRSILSIDPIHFLHFNWIHYHHFQIIIGLKSKHWILYWLKIFFRVTQSKMLVKKTHRIYKITHYYLKYRWIVFSWNSH